MNPGPSIEIPTKQSSFSKLDFIKIANSLGFKPTIFEALYRMQSDLSGFPKYSDYTGKSSEKFPIKYFNFSFL